MTTRRRKTWSYGIFKIKKPRYDEYWQAHEYPLMLVMRAADGQIQWMDVSEYLKWQDKVAKQVIFEGEPFTALSLVRLRDRVLSELTT
jgi:hypothetical protein